MRFTPKTETQIIDERLLPPGVYDFEVIHSEDKVSKKGNDMIHVGLRVYRTDGNGYVLVDDYLMESLLYKLLHFCAAGGLTAKYEAGELTSDDCMGVCGRVKIKREQQDGFEPKNAVQDYVKPKEGETEARTPAPRTTAPAHVVEDLDTDIPF